MNLGKIKELKELLDSGAINESEFEELKRKIIQGLEEDIKEKNTKVATEKVVDKRPLAIVIVSILLFLGCVGSAVGLYFEPTNLKYPLGILMYLWLPLTLLKGDNYARISLNLFLSGEIIFSIKTLLELNNENLTSLDFIFLLLTFGLPILLLILINSGRTLLWLKQNRFKTRVVFIYKVLPFIFVLTLSFLHQVIRIYPGFPINIVPILFLIIFSSIKIKAEIDNTVKLGNQVLFCSLVFSLMLIPKFILAPAPFFSYNLFIWGSLDEIFQYNYSIPVFLDEYLITLFFFLLSLIIFIFLRKQKLSNKKHDLFIGYIITCPLLSSIIDRTENGFLLRHVRPNVPDGPDYYYISFLLLSLLLLFFFFFHLIKPAKHFNTIDKVLYIILPASLISNFVCQFFGFYFLTDILGLIFNLSLISIGVRWIFMIRKLTNAIDVRE